jgi:AcrR family transcriptional regulator
MASRQRASRDREGRSEEVVAVMSPVKPAPLERSLSGRSRPARDVLAREQVSEIQRARIVSAMVAVASEQGVGYASVSRVVARSGVSRRTFYEQFEDREDCFIAAVDVGVARASRCVLDLYDPGAKWSVRIRTALAALLRFLDAERAVARLLVVETLGAGPKALEHRRRVLSRIIAVVDEGRQESKGGGPPPLTAEGLVGGALSLIHAHMVDSEDASLIELLGPLVSMIALPYLGPAAARRELDRRPVSPTRRNGPPSARMDPLHDLDMRLTYRTVRVLLAIGEQDVLGSYPSNRQVADASGIRDQGQVSKLLTRLEHLGLIRNAGDPKAKGEPNAWTLTQKGGDVQAAISAEPGKY